MKISPELFVTDLENYLEKYFIRLTKGGKKVISDIEYIRYENNSSPNEIMFLIALIGNIIELKELFMKHNLNVQLASFLLMKNCILSRDEYDSYDSDLCYYSISGSRNILPHTRIIDICIRNSNLKMKREISEYDILEALLEDHDLQYPEWKNIEWSDYRLHTPYNTLSHIIGNYNSNLWIGFNEIRSQIVMPKDNISVLSYQIVI